MAKSRGRSRPAQRDSTRWIVGASALVVAGLALYVLMIGGASAPGPDDIDRSSDRDRPPGRTAPALDDIDAESREAMRDLLREAGD